MESQLDAFSNRTMPLLKHLYIGSSKIATFSNNSLPLLWKFNAEGTQLTSL